MTDRGDRKNRVWREGERQRREIDPGQMEEKGEERENGKESERERAGEKKKKKSTE